MIVSIIRPDSYVVVDGVAAPVDCSDLPAFIRAIQWDTETCRGHIELMADANGRVYPNMSITDFAAYDYLCDRHREALASAAVKEKEAELSVAEKKVRDARVRAEQEAEMRAVAAEMQARVDAAIAEKQAADDRVTAMEVRLAELENQIARAITEAKSIAGE